ncbi:MAG: hypothetical protein NZ899_04885 [Thermoguttaceae bacterium]|nr:hypothetical protein [Thermoguttaceae bacterium]MDW8077922.1 hypothetical protein [Thermoguttaceae bacterium]
MDADAVCGKANRRGGWVSLRIVTWMRTAVVNAGSFLRRLVLYKPVKEALSPTCGTLKTKC